jgi:hypothetical protein
VLLNATGFKAHRSDTLVSAFDVGTILTRFALVLNPNPTSCAKKSTKATIFYVPDAFPLRRALGADPLPS